jgi:hypoxanthine phosphoribosyltransferase
MLFRRRRVISIEEINKICDILGENVTNPKPDFIVSIESGGWYIGHRIAKRLSLPHFSITIRRKTVSTRLYEIFPNWLKIIPTIIHGVIFLIRKPVLQRKLSRDSEKEIITKNILIVDDVLQSGMTINMGVLYLKSIGAETVRTLVISNVFKKKVDHDYQNGILFYPWSKCSNEYTKYLEIRSNLTETT